MHVWLDISRVDPISWCTNRTEALRDAKADQKAVSAGQGKADIPARSFGLFLSDNWGVYRTQRDKGPLLGDPLKQNFGIIVKFADLGFFDWDLQSRRIG